MLAIGLTGALRARGRTVQTFKKGPDFIDPMWLATASGRACWNLDFNTQPVAEIEALYAQRAADADITLIEGNKGLHDGVALDGRDSNAAMARLLDCPVLLVVDTTGMTRGIAPIVRGIAEFDPAVRVAGVILNRVGGPRHEGKLRAALETYTDLPVVGALARQSALAVDERHLGLIPSNESAIAREQIERLIAAVTDGVDLDAIEQLADAAPRRSWPVQPALPAQPVADVRIGIARGAAFGFYYPDDLEAFAQAGAELVPFDPETEAEIPACDALFIGGGFPEMRMDALERNAEMRAAIRAFCDAGRPVYAECGGLMYLGRSIAWNDQRHAMVGALPLDTTMHRRPQGRGYVVLEETPEFPWPDLQSGAAHEPVRAHEFHHSSAAVDSTDGLHFGFTVLRGHGVDGRRDGVVYNRIFATYAHQRAVGGRDWPRRFVAYIRDLRTRQGSPDA
ncbi:MAG: cobyrinate a,c-diamide synthase [Chromatiales bacterium]|nr:cobyrinate a,c-diamide synthase [Chromatiales bacterium]